MVGEHISSVGYHFTFFQHLGLFSVSIFRFYLHNTLFIIVL